MKSVQDSLYNWLTIKVVSDARPEDLAATETEEMFLRILKEEHGITDLIINKEEEFYDLSYRLKDESKTTRFPRELVEGMLEQINESPDRYKIYPQ